MLRKIIISGGPHTGKTTLLNELKLVYPNASFLEEPAGSIIKNELRLHEQDRTYNPIVPWTNRYVFNKKVIEMYMGQESNVSDGLCFQDRSLIDTLAYCKYLGFEDLVDEIEKKIINSKYNYVFFCAPIGDYAKTEIRSEDQAEALAINKFLKRTYQQSGLDMTELADTSVEERQKVVSNLIKR